MELDNFIELLKNIEKRKNVKFTGLGLILYDSLDYLQIAPLKQIPKALNLPVTDLEEITDLLLSISLSTNPFHDGFHMINSSGLLTHLSQYFSTPIIVNANIEFEYGSRHRTALYGSYIKGVAAVGVCSKDESPIVYIKGAKKIISA